MERATKSNDGEDDEDLSWGEDSDQDQDQKEGEQDELVESNKTKIITTTSDNTDSPVIVEKNSKNNNDTKNNNSDSEDWEKEFDMSPEELADLANKAKIEGKTGDGEDSDELDWDD